MKALASSSTKGFPERILKGVRGSWVGGWVGELFCNTVCHHLQYFKAGQSNERVGGDSRNLLKIQNTMCAARRSTSVTLSQKRTSLHIFKVLRTGCAGAKRQLLGCVLQQSTRTVQCAFGNCTSLASPWTKNIQQLSKNTVEHTGNLTAHFLHALYSKTRHSSITKTQCHTTCANVTPHTTQLFWDPLEILCVEKKKKHCSYINFSAVAPENAPGTILVMAEPGKDLPIAWKFKRSVRGGGISNFEVRATINETTKQFRARVQQQHKWHSRARMRMCVCVCVCVCVCMCVCVRPRATHTNLRVVMFGKLDQDVPRGAVRAPECPTTTTTAVSAPHCALSWSRWKIWQTGSAATLALRKKRRIDAIAAAIGARIVWSSSHCVDSVLFEKMKRVVARDARAAGARCTWGWLWKIRL